MVENRSDPRKSRSLDSASGPRFHVESRGRYELDVENGAEYHKAKGGRS